VARIAQLAHANGTELREETIKSGLIAAADFDLPVRSKKMIGERYN
jgi:fumarate hydratase class II